MKSRDSNSVQWYAVSQPAIWVSQLHPVDVMSKLGASVFVAAFLWPR